MLEKFLGARNVIEEFMIWPLLSTISALISFTTSVKASSLYSEPVNIYTIFLAESTAFSLAVDAIIEYVQEKQETIIVIEDSLRSGLYKHLKSTGGQGFLAKDEAYDFFTEIMERN